VENLLPLKPSDENLSQELETAKRKMQGLDGLLNSGKISPFTYDYLKKELASHIAEMEKRRKALAEKVTSIESISKEIAKPKVIKKKRIRKPKKRMAKKISAKKFKSSTVRPSPKKGYSGLASKNRCRNPWNGECRNTDIEVTIYYKNRLLPICRECWNDIAEKDLTW
jgi:aminopeptidase N